MTKNRISGLVNSGELVHGAFTSVFFSLLDKNKILHQHQENWLVPLNPWIALANTGLNAFLKRTDKPVCVSVHVLA